MRNLSQQKKQKSRDWEYWELVEAGLVEAGLSVNCPKQGLPSGCPMLALVLRVMRRALHSCIWTLKQEGPCTCSQRAFRLGEEMDAHTGHCMESCDRQCP
jgi:hypothetical protein